MKITIEGADDKVIELIKMLRAGYVPTNFQPYFQVLDKKEELTGKASYSIPNQIDDKRTAKLEEADVAKTLKLLLGSIDKNAYWRRLKTFLEDLGVTERDPASHIKNLLHAHHIPNRDHVPRWSDGQVNYLMKKFGWRTQSRSEDIRVIV